jgi:hypothetical protein
MQVLPIVNHLLVYIDIAAPYIVKAWEIAQTVYSYTPVNIIEAVYGLALCFFGGMYPLTIAAGETFRVSGGDRVKKCIGLLWEDVKAVHQVRAFHCAALWQRPVAGLKRFPCTVHAPRGRMPALRDACTQRCSAESFTRVSSPPHNRCGGAREGRQAGIWRGEASWKERRVVRRWIAVHVLDGGIKRLKTEGKRERRERGRRERGRLW